MAEVKRGSSRGQRALVLVAALGLGACGDDQDPAGAARFWERIQSSSYRNWNRAPGYEGRRPSNTSHETAVDIYVNETVQKALQSNMRLDTWPVGSILVKDAFDGSSHEAVAAMEKREDGWYWAEWDANGTSLFSGKPKLCIQCHASGADGVRAFALPRGP